MSDGYVFPRVSLVFVFAALLIGGLYLLPTVQTTTKRKRSPCHNNVLQLGIALFNYDTSYGSLPPAFLADDDGKPMHSWRVLVLPFLDQNDLYKQYNFDEPWDGPNNRKLETKMPALFACPDDSARKNLRTSYVVVVGQQTPFQGRHSRSVTRIPDGSSNTILVAEMADSGIHWMEPRDLEFEKMSYEIGVRSSLGIRSSHGRASSKGARTIFCDGSSRYLSQIKPDIVKALLTADGGEMIADHEF